ncbi:hypothetical protein RvY_17411 [Ramazzottius varieornatus]|uniref:Uncharacterized protein n=1 Tax=Ramazzottius varieornatus TaxID=947166 RepID=A0A1D1W210_RAMVA|nr:hypothetical protein RvY_17411 [Ramazzottius varieornatus]
MPKPRPVFYEWSVEERRLMEKLAVYKLIEPDHMCKNPDQKPI